MVIDDDLGRSGAQSAGRAGFQRLVADVGLGQVGIVLSLEESRLARNLADWHRLLEICALADTLILDEDGLYDPNQFNDRLILGMRGTMSEAELHFLRVRLDGGKLNKARRGELRTPLPAGLVDDADGRIDLAPDRQVRQAIQDLFLRFERTAPGRWSASSARRASGCRCGCGRAPGPARRPGWRRPSAGSLSVLKNPRYAGMYFYGRTRQTVLSAISCIRTIQDRTRRSRPCRPQRSAIPASQLGRSSSGVIRPTTQAGSPASTMHRRFSSLHRPNSTGSPIVWPPRDGSTIPARSGRRRRRQDERRRNRRELTRVILDSCARFLRPSNGPWPSPRRTWATSSSPYLSVNGACRTRSR